MGRRNDPWKIATYGVALVCIILIGREWVRSDDAASLAESVAPFATMQTAAPGETCWADIDFAYDGSAWARPGDPCKKERESPFYTSRVRKLPPLRRFFGQEEHPRFVLLGLDPGPSRAVQERSYYELVGRFQVFREVKVAEEN